MSGAAIVMMLVICGFIWGGFVYFLIRAVRSEARKSSSPQEGD
jgi:hypothetical protein